MIEICRTCLREVNDNSLFYYLDVMDSKTKTITIRCKLVDCIPEMDLDVVPNSVICSKCFESLTIAHEFKNKCLETEGKIQSYIEQMGYVVTSVNLKEIVRQNKQLDDFQDVKTHSHYDNGKNCIEQTTVNLNNHETCNKEKNLDLKNLQCDTRNIFALPKIAQLLAAGTNSSSSFECNQCNFVSSSDIELESHKKSAHETQALHKCSECIYTAPKRQALIIHMRKHSKNDTLNKNILTQVNAGERRYKCIKCDFSSIYCSALNKHLKSHLDHHHEKTFKCNWCDYKTRLKFDLKKHAKTQHSNEKAHKCVLCDYSSSRRTNLLHHMQSHNGFKLYKCKMCNYNSSQTSNSENHSNAIDDKALPCSFCDYLNRLKNCYNDTTSSQLMLNNVITKQGEDKYETAVKKEMTT